MYTPEPPTSSLHTDPSAHPGAHSHATSPLGPTTAPRSPSASSAYSRSTWTDEVIGGGGGTGPRRGGPRRGGGAPRGLGAGPGKPEPARPSRGFRTPPTRRGRGGRRPGPGGG